jgi:hypothetical protein
LKYTPDEKVLGSGFSRVIAKMSGGIMYNPPQ